MIDTDESRYTSTRLHAWKIGAERRAQRRLEESASSLTPSGVLDAGETKGDDQQRVVFELILDVDPTTFDDDLFLKGLGAFLRLGSVTLRRREQGSLRLTLEASGRDVARIEDAFDRGLLASQRVLAVGRREAVAPSGPNGQQEDSAIAIGELRLRGHIDHLRAIWNLGEAVLDLVPFPSDPAGTRYNLLLATQEVVLNVLRHAYLLDTTRPIVAVFLASKIGATIVVKDNGPPFDPVATLRMRSDAATDFATDGTGGFGLHIASLVVDHMHYDRRGDWNVLQLYKSARSRSPRPAIASLPTA